MPEIQPFVYECGNDHGITSPKEITQCPAYRDGKPCTGVLKKIGGPRAKKTTTK